MVDTPTNVVLCHEGVDELLTLLLVWEGLDELSDKLPSRSSHDMELWEAQELEDGGVVWATEQGRLGAVVVVPGRGLSLAILDKSQLGQSVGRTRTGALSPALAVRTGVHRGGRLLSQ